MYASFLDILRQQVPRPVNILLVGPCRVAASVASMDKYDTILRSVSWILEIPSVETLLEMFKTDVDWIMSFRKLYVLHGCIRWVVQRLSKTETVSHPQTLE